MQQLARRHFILAGLAMPVAARSNPFSSPANLPALTLATLPASRSAPKPWLHAPQLPHLSHAR
jgi:hypothetical protein